MKRNSKELTVSISRLREAIRRKYNRFKQGIVDTDILLEKQYKPLISELRKKSYVGTKTEPKEEPKEEPMDEDENEESYENYPFRPNIASSPKRIDTLDEEEFFGDDNDTPTVSQLIQSPSRLQEASIWINENFTSELARKYMLKFMKDESGSKNKIDNIYGPRMEGDRLMVGDKMLQFEDDGSIRIGETSYGGTEGLYELLFKRAPNDKLYSDNDLTVYKDILLKTNAHKKGYVRTGHINRPYNSIKYKAIIADLFPKQLYSGKGMVAKDLLTSSDIQFWDDPNELCTRLGLLVSSAEAGNTGHKNEILNIVSELREANIIKGAGNSRFRSLIQ